MTTTKTAPEATRVLALLLRVPANRVRRLETKPGPERRSTWSAALDPRPLDTTADASRRPGATRLLIPPHAVRWSNPMSTFDSATARGIATSRTGARTILALA